MKKLKIKNYRIEYLQMWPIAAFFQKAFLGKQSANAPKAIFMKWSGDRPSHGSFGVFVAITQSIWVLRGVRGNLPVSTM